MAAIASAINSAGQASSDVLRSISFAASALDLHEKTVSRWAREGRIKSVLLGTSRKIPDSEIRRIQEQGIEAS